MNSPGDNILLTPSLMDSGADSRQPENDGLQEYVLPEEEPRPSPPSSPQINLWSLMAKIMISPIEGWKDLRRNKITPDSVGFGLFLPIVTIAALSDFILLIYDPHIEVLKVIFNCIITFVSFFIGYFISGFLAKLLLPSPVKPLPFSNFGKCMAMISIATLALFHVLGELLPIFEPIFYFLPLWTVYIIVKGMKFVRISENRSTYTLGVMCVTIVGSPIFVEWCFSLLSF